MLSSEADGDATNVKFKLHLFELNNEPLVEILADEKHQLVSTRLVDGLFVGVGGWLLDAPPMELFAARAPVTTLPCTNKHRVLLVVVGVYVETNRHLPADIWFEVDGPLAAFERQAMQRTPRPSVETTAVQEDASAVNLAGDPRTLFVLLEGAALLSGPSNVLPIALVQQSR